MPSTVRRPPASAAIPRVSLRRSPAQRAAFREAHLALAREAHRRGDLILAGALPEPPDRAVLVWRTEDRSVVERFIDGDPYVRNGLVTSWTIRPWTVVVGNGAGQS